MEIIYKIQSYGAMRKEYKQWTYHKFLCLHSSMMSVFEILLGDPISGSMRKKSTTTTIIKSFLKSCCVFTHGTYARGTYPTDEL